MQQDLSMLLALLAGLIPLFYMAAMARQFGARALISLEAIFLLANWFAYNLNPWIAYFGGNWQNPLLVPNYVVQSVWFSTLAAIAFILGFRLVRQQHGKGYPQLAPNIWQLGAVITPTLLITLMLLALPLFLFSIGGLSEFWSASTPRGFGQFDKVSGYARAINIAKIILSSLSMALATVSGLYIIQQRRINDVFFIVFGFLGLLIASLPSMHAFSRGAGVAFIVTGVLAFRLEGLRAIRFCLLFFIVGGFLGSVGYSERSNYMPGVGNFLTAATQKLWPSDDIQVQAAPEENRDLTAWNSLSAVEPWTLKAWSADHDQTDRVTDAINFLFNLNPLPSAIVPEKQIGRSLSQILNTTGHTGITTPLLAELHYIFGYAGAVAMLVVGCLFAWLENLSDRGESRWLPVVISLAIFSIFIGLHQSGRAFSRGIWYGLCVLALSRMGGSRELGPSQIRTQVPHQHVVKVAGDS